MTSVASGATAGRDPSPAPGPVRRAQPRRFVMCPPAYFAVDYEINAWMHADRPVDRDLARAQWSAVRDTYEALGHRVDVIDPVPGLPDLVFVANAGLVIGGRVLLSRFRHAERTGEEDVFAAWFEAQGFEVVRASGWNEGEGDLLLAGDVVLAGWGFRTDRRAHDEVADFAGREVVSLELVDPRWYHLDTALAVLDADTATIAYHPGAFSPASRRVLRERYPDAIVVSGADARVFGLNACSDGRHVVLATGATGFVDQLASHGFEPVLVDTAELQKAGGSVKCVTLELRA